MLLSLKSHDLPREVKMPPTLRQQGFKYLKRVKGGLTAWREEVDSNVPQY